MESYTTELPSRHYLPTFECSPDHYHSTRHSNNNFHLPSIQTENGRKAFQYWAPYLWKILPNPLKGSLTPSAFSKAVKPIIYDIAQTYYNRF